MKKIWPNNFWIVTMPRTASTFLSRTLSKTVGLNPSLNFFDKKDNNVCHEHFHPSGPYSSLDSFLELKAPCTKFMINWLDRLDGYRPPSKTKIICLTRDDLRAQAISYMQASIEGKFHAYSAREKKKKLERRNILIKQDGFEYELGKTMKFFRQLKNKCFEFTEDYDDVLFTTFEKITDDSDDELNRILKFLKIRRKLKVAEKA